MTVRCFSRSLHAALACALLLAASFAPAPLARAQTADVELVDYTVQERDTCAAIARRWFGDAHRYDLIHAYNPEMGPPPHRLVPGTVLHLPRTAPADGVVPDARVTQVAREVLARSRDAEEWGAAPRGLGLYRGWHVRTDDRASAEVTFRDTSVVHLREETVIIIFGDTAGAVRQGGTEASLERGTLRSRLGELRGGLALHVTTQSGSVDFQGGSAVVSVDPEGTSRVSVHEGEGQLRGATGAPTRVPAGMGSKVRRSERPMRPRPLPATPSWSTAGPLRFAGVLGRGASVSGEWGAVERAAMYRVEIARQADGREVVAAVEVPATVTRFAMHGLPSGTYHVRISSIDDDHFESRPSGALVIEVVEATLSAPGASSDASATVPVPSGEAPDALHAPSGTRLVAPTGYTCTTSDAAATGELVLEGSGDVLVRCAPADGVALAPLAIVIDARPPAAAVQLADVEATRGAPMPVALAFEAPLPDDVTVLAPDGVAISDVQRVDGGVSFHATASDRAVSPVLLRIVSARAPNVTIGEAHLVLVLPEVAPVVAVAPLIRPPTVRLRLLGGAWTGGRPMIVLGELQLGIDITLVPWASLVIGASGGFRDFGVAAGGIGARTLSGDLSVRFGGDVGAFTFDGGPLVRAGAAWWVGSPNDPRVMGSETLAAWVGVGAIARLGIELDPRLVRLELELEGGGMALPADATVLGGTAVTLGPGWLALRLGLSVALD